MTGKKQLDRKQRELIIKKFEGHKGPREISIELELKESTVASVIRLFRTTGRIAAVKRRTPKVEIIPDVPVL